jgi:hypothetical protein
MEFRDGFTKAARLNAAAARATSTGAATWMTVVIASTAELTSSPGRNNGGK